MIRSGLLLLVALLLFCQDGDVSRGHQLAIVASFIASLLCARSTFKLVQLVEFCFAFNAFFVVTNRLSLLKHVLKHPFEMQGIIVVVLHSVIYWRRWCHVRREGGLLRCSAMERAAIDLLMHVITAHAVFTASRAATAHAAMVASSDHANIYRKLFALFGNQQS